MLETLETRERRYVKPKEAKALFTSTTNIICPICGGKHFMQRCEKLLKLKINERIDEVKGAKLCINCLKKGHYPNKCKAGKCRLYTESHNTLLHADKVVGKIDETEEECSTERAKTLASCSSTKESQILLSTVCIEVHGKNEEIYNARAVLDSGSQSSFVIEELCNRCDIPISNMKFAVSCLNNVETPIKGKCAINIKSKHEPFETKLECLVMKEITGCLPNTSFNKQRINLPENIKLADPAFNECAKVDILIGADRFWEIICPEQKGLGKIKPVLKRTKLGWIISGPLGDQVSNKIRCNLVSKIDLQDDLARFWELEECKISASRKWSEDEKKCEDNFTRTTRREPDGRFVVTLPLKTAPENLGQSFEHARNRFINLERKLQGNKSLKEPYTDFMHEYEELGHMSKIKDNHVGYYLPHHCVLKEDSTTTNLRVVFEASARTSSGMSLNDIMMVGPNIQEDLVSILLRFREHKYVVSADITKMYRQVLVTPEQRHLQKIVWRDQPSDELSVYQLNTITYGTSAASFLAIRSLYQLAQDIKTERPKISRIIERDFYVDDLLSGSDSAEEAAIICKEVKETLEKGRFVLRKFCSNEPSVLKHVSTRDNPADLLSRGTTFSQLQESELWWHAPKWLMWEREKWPHTKAVKEEIPELLEKPFTCILAKNVDVFPFERFSSLTRLKRSVAYILRFKNNCLAPPEKRGFGPLDLEEISNATTILIKLAQRQVYCEEIKKLEKEKYISEGSNILCLKPFLVKKGVLRIGGRISNSDFDFTKKHPIILPKEHHLTKLFFRHLHKELHHAAPTLLLATMREEYWPISGRNGAKQAVRSCVRCSRCKPRFMQPCMGNLPKERLTPNLPFRICGVDYMGPLIMKDRKGRGCKTFKYYLSLFVCFATKAIHLELVTSLTKDAFIMALRRFVSRRGKPQTIHSDNGTNFVAANNELKEVASFLRENEDNIREECVRQEIKWEFIPPHSPHFGGLWEAGVKAVKHHLKRVVGNTIFTYEELYTLSVQIEAILNSRPLSPLSSDPEDLNPLTPGHFLVGKPLVAVPDSNYTEIQSNRLSIYQHIQAIQQHFWRRWSREYIAEMQRRNKWKTSTGTLGDHQR